MDATMDHCLCMGPSMQYPFLTDSVSKLMPCSHKPCFTDACGTGWRYIYAATQDEC